METIKEKKGSFFSGFSYILWTLFFVGYSSFILTEHRLLCSVLCLLSCLGFIVLGSSVSTYTKEEKDIITDVKDARWFIEPEENDELSNRKINALVSFFRSRKKEMGWKGVNEILRDYDYWGDDLWQDAARIRERKRLWEK